jgi:hypothetical protein
MSEKKIIVVFGATGAQGGGLVRAILDDPDGGFAARAMTRDPSAPKAGELADLGAEVVAGDLDDAASLERGLAGAYGAYFVTFFWAHFSPEREKAEAKSMAEAAKAVGLRHAIWSTLEDTRRWIPLSDERMPTLMGQYKVPHFDAKGESNAYFTELGVPTTFLLTSFYWDNLIHFGMGPKLGPDGRCAYGIFKAGGEHIGKTLGIAGEHLTGAQMATELGRALGREVIYNAVTPAEYRAFGFPGADDLGNMFQFKQELEADFCGARDPAVARSLNPRLQDFRTWLDRNKHRISVE